MMLLMIEYFNYASLPSGSSSYAIRIDLSLTNFFQQSLAFSTLQS